MFYETDCIWDKFKKGLTFTKNNLPLTKNVLPNRDLNKTTPHIF